MPPVIIRQTQYDYSRLRPQVFEILDALGPFYITNNSQVLIKPNLLAPATPESAVVTHPLIIRAAAEYALEKGGKVQISDSPAVGSFEKTLKVSGIIDALSGLPVKYKEFKESVLVDVGEPFKKIEIARDAMTADTVINLPKLKTHSQMLITLGIKNLFGCVVGMKKPEWHLRTGVDKEKFATLLVKIYQAISPSITLIDGILAMEGQGPGKGGQPRHIGVILGSNNALAADIAVCKMLGIHPNSLLTNKIANVHDIKHVEIDFDKALPFVDNFTLPEMVPIVFGPKRFHGLMRRHLVQRPVCKDYLCKHCGECREYCPAGAITHHKTNIRFDYDKCIRCYCCIEVCPHGALTARETMIGKLTRKIFNI